MDEAEQERPKRNKVRFSIDWPADLNKKLEYIKKRTFLTKQQVVLMLCSKGIEGWCKTLMDEEVSLRTAKIHAPIRKASPPLGGRDLMSEASTVNRIPNDVSGIEKSLVSEGSAAQGSFYLSSDRAPSSITRSMVGPPVDVVSSNGWKPVPDVPGIPYSQAPVQPAVPKGYDPWTVPLDKT